MTVSTAVSSLTLLMEAAISFIAPVTSSAEVAISCALAVTLSIERVDSSMEAAVSLMESHGVPREESERAFNCGVGMIAAVAGESADAAVARLVAAGIPAWVAGSIEARTDDGGPAAHLVGTYR